MSAAPFVHPSGFPLLHASPTRDLLPSHSPGAWSIFCSVLEIWCRTKCAVPRHSQLTLIWYLLPPSRPLDPHPFLGSSSQSINSTTGSSRPTLLPHVIGPSPPLSFTSSSCTPHASPNCPRVCCLSHTPSISVQSLESASKPSAEGSEHPGRLCPS